MNNISIGKIILRAVAIIIGVLGLMLAIFGGQLVGNAASGMKSAPSLAGVSALNPAEGQEAPNGCDPGGSYNILVIYANLPTSLPSGLLAQPGIESVDSFDASAATPTIAQLAQYNLVVVQQDIGMRFSNAAGLGDALADYMDSGGAVVAAQASFRNFDLQGIEGRWRTGGYSPFNYNPDNATNPVSLGIHNPYNPLMQGVTGLGAEQRMLLTVSSGALMVASYSDGSPAAAYKWTGGHLAVGISASLGGSNWAMGDYARLIANAARLAGPPACAPTATVTSTRTATRTATATGTGSPTPGPACNPSGNYRVLIVYAEGVAGSPSMLRAELLAQPGIQSVDLFDAGLSTPSLALLVQYDIVLTYSNFPYTDYAALGDLLSFYQDNGGIVIVSYGSSLLTEGYLLGGRWQSGGYTPIAYTSWSGNSATTLLTYNQNHPLMAGVATLNAGARVLSGAAPGGTRLAEYADHYTAVAIKSTDGRMAIGFSAYLGNGAGRGIGDYARIVANAGRWLRPSTCAPTVTHTPTATNTSTVTRTSTTTSTGTITNTPTRTSTATNTPTATRTGTPLPGTPTCPWVPGWQEGATVPQTFDDFAYAQAGPNDIYIMESIFNYHYNATSNSWETKASVPYSALEASATYDSGLGGRIYLAGGLAIWTDFLYYDIPGNFWQQLPDLPQGRVGAAMGAHNGRVFVAGGKDQAGNATNTIQIYTRSSNSWAVSGVTLPSSFYMSGYAQTGQYLYMAGNFNNGFGSNVALRLDMSNTTVSIGPAFPAAMYGIGLTGDFTKLYAMGGQGDNGPSNELWTLDVSAWPSGTWVRSLSNLPSPRAGAAGFYSIGRTGGEIWSTGPDHIYLPLFTGCLSPTPTRTPTITNTPTRTATAPTSTGTHTATPVPAGVFCNSAQITLPDAGAGLPYPSSIQVSGLGNVVASLGITITGITHPYLDDIDLLLAGPNGQRVMLMSDAGGHNAANNLNLSFRDSAPFFLSDEGQLFSGYYKPTDYETDDSLPSPAPARPYGTALATFGGSPNGTWSLYAADDEPLYAGAIAGGWCVGITTAPATLTPTRTVTPSRTPTCSPGGGPDPWVAASPVPAGMSRYAFAQNGFDFYLISGVDTGNIIDRNYRYNAATGTWQSGALIPVGREAPAAVYNSANNRIYVMGGNAGSPSSRLDIYDVAANTWSTGANLPQARWGAAAGIWNGNIYMVGGNNPPTNNVQIYNIASNSWSAGTNAPSAYFMGGYAQVGQYLYMVGGYGSGSANSTITMRLDMSNNTWSAGPFFTQARADFGLVAYNNKLIAIGGDTTGGGVYDPTTQVDQLDLSAWPGGTWVQATNSLPSARQGNRAFSLPSGRLWTSGGLNSSQIAINEHLTRDDTFGGCTTPSSTPTASNTPTATQTRTATRTATITNTPTVTPTSTPHCEGFIEDFEEGTLGSFASEVVRCDEGGCGWQIVTDTVHSGNYAAHALKVPDNEFMETRLVLSNTLSVQAGITTTLSFWQQYSFFTSPGTGSCLDGGVLELSTNNGISWQDADPYITGGGYTGTVQAGSGGVLAGRRAWCGSTAGYNEVRVNLTSLAGQGVRIRLRMGASAFWTGNSFSNWWVDEVAVRTSIGAGCATATPSKTPTVTHTPTATNTPACSVPAQWTVRSSLPTPLYRYAWAAQANTLYIMSGVGADGTLSSAAFRYDASTDTWTTLAAVPHPQQGAAAAIWNGNIYLMGGTGNAAALQVYNIASNSWSAGPALPSARFGAAAAAHNGKVYLAGGSASGLPSDSLLIFDITSNSWSAGPIAPAPFLWGGYTQVGQYLYMAGSYGASPGGASEGLDGITSPGGVLAPSANGQVTMRLDMVAGAWTTGPQWTPGRADFGLASDGDILYALGGDAQGGTFFDPSAEVYELSLRAWPAGAWLLSPHGLPSPRQGNTAGFFSTAQSGGEIWSSGGYNSDTGLTAHIFRNVTGASCITPSATATRTPTLTPAVTSTHTATLTATRTNTPIFTATGTATGTHTNIPTSTTTATASITGTNTAIASATGTATRTPTASPTNTQTTTSTTTPTFTPISTATAIASNTATSIPTLTSTTTATHSNTPTATLAASTTSTPTRTTTPTFTSTVIPTRTNTPVVASPVLTATSTTTSTALVTATTTGTPSCTEFSDVPPGSTFYTFVRCLVCRGIISGYSDGTFRPSTNAGRGQLSKIVSNAAGYSDPRTDQTFEDVPAGSTFHLFVERLASRGIISGYSCGGPGEPCIAPMNRPYFRPATNITRGQTSKIVALAAGLPDPPSGSQSLEDIPPTHTFYRWIERMALDGIISGYPCGGAGEPCVSPLSRPYFRSSADVTRGQTAKIVSNTFFPACIVPGKR